MKIRYNERGGALLVVLLLVVVFKVVGMGLLTMNISAAKQFNKKEEQVQARHLAEMGVLHYKAEVKQTVDDYHQNAFEYVYINNEIDYDASEKKYYNELCDAVSSETLKYIMLKTKDTRKYTVEKNSG